ncbi:hypothetical protein GCM10009808_26120 [Microbacterium sediminicola]|uniref:Uncharacterized protein n=1 Tax=Microbacterium sediminicola TaxID=415210 RepID=A0ABP4UQA9_9MICO
MPAFSAVPEAHPITIGTAGIANHTRAPTMPAMITRNGTATRQSRPLELAMRHLRRQRYDSQWHTDPYDTGPRETGTRKTQGPGKPGPLRHRAPGNRDP